MINWQLSKQGIRWPVSLARIAGSGVDPSSSSIFWSHPLTRYWFSNDRRLKFIFLFNLIHMKCCFYVLHNQNFDFKLTLDANRQGRQLLLTFSPCLLPCSRVGHALRPIFMLWLVKIWQVSSCGKFMQHLESCLLWQLKPTGFCVNLWCF